MHIAIHASDFLICATEHQSLDKDDVIQVHYTLLLRDNPTGRTVELHCKNEVEQSYMVAAWIIADEQDLGVLRPYYDKLKERLPKGFLP